jgi:hypothetical protein
MFGLSMQADISRQAFGTVRASPLNSASPIDERLGCRRLVNCPRQAHDDLRGPYLDAKRFCRSRSFCTSWIPPATRAAFL